MRERERERLCYSLRLLDVVVGSIQFFLGSFFPRLLFHLLYYLDNWNDSSFWFATPLVVSLSLFYIFIIFDILGNATRCRDDDDDKIYIYDLKRRVISCLLHTKGRRRKGKEMNSKSKMTSICTLTDQYIVSCFYISPRETRFYSLNISSDSIFFPPVLIRVVFLSDRDSHRRPNGVVPSVMSVLYVSCRSISPSQQSFLLSHTHDVCLLLSSSQLFREYRPSRRASCVWNMETRTSGARRDFSSFSAPFMRVAKRLPFFPIFLLPLSFLELIILVSGYVSSLTEKTAGRWKRDGTNNS